MTHSLTVHDESASGNRTHSFSLEFLTQHITVRELIRRRVYEEVMEYNQKATDYIQSLVQPTGAEQTLNGFRLKKRRRVDWEEQADRALAAFGTNGFFILVGDRQAETLDEQIALGLGTEVSFVKLVPLVGG